MHSHDYDLEKQPKWKKNSFHSFEDSRDIAQEKSTNSKKKSFQAKDQSFEEKKLPPNRKSFEDSSGKEFDQVISTFRYVLLL